MTLQSLLGSTSGENNLLAITGSAHLGGTINITLDENADSTTYQLGDTFILLKADAGLVTNSNNVPYQFANLPAGYYSTHQYLPDGTPVPAISNSSNYGYSTPFNLNTSAMYTPDLPPLAEGHSQNDSESGERNYIFPQRHNLRMAA